MPYSTVIAKTKGAGNAIAEANTSGRAARGPSGLARWTHHPRWPPCSNGPWWKRKSDRAKAVPGLHHSRPWWDAEGVPPDLPAKEAAVRCVRTADSRRSADSFVRAQFWRNYL